jgi:hypothetical protein
LLPLSYEVPGAKGAQAKCAAQQPMGWRSQALGQCYRVWAGIAGEVLRRLAF